MIMMVITMCVCYLFYNSVRSTVSCLYLMFVLTHLTFVCCSLRTFEFVYDSQLIGASRGETIHPERFWPVQANAGTVFRFYFSDCQIAFKSKQAVPGSSSWGGGGGGDRGAVISPPWPGFLDRPRDCCSAFVLVFISSENNMFRSAVPFCVFCIVSSVENGTRWAQ